MQTPSRWSLPGLCRLDVDLTGCVALESLRKEKSSEIIWKNYPHLNADDKRALAIYPEILPPPEYDYPRILINWLDGLTHEELAAYCNNPKAISPPTKTFVRDTLVG